MLVNFNVVVASLLSEARRHSSIHAKGCVSEGYTPPPFVDTHVGVLMQT